MYMLYILMNESYHDSISSVNVGNKQEEKSKSMKVVYVVSCRLLNAVIMKHSSVNKSVEIRFDFFFLHFYESQNK